MTRLPTRVQLAKYAAKLRLLDYGLLGAAQGIDDLSDYRWDDKADNDMQVDEDESQETEDEFLSRVDKYVNIHLNSASSSKRDNYKDNLVYQARKDLISEFLKSTILKRCQNGDCGQQVSTYGTSPLS